MRVMAVLCGVLLALSGCYRYQPATLEAVPVGTAIRGLLGTEARVALEDRYRRRFDQLDGTLVERNGDSLLVEVRSLSAVDGRPLYQRVGLAEADVLRVDVKRLHKVRTIALVAGVAGMALIAVINGFWSGGAAGNGGGGPPEAPPVLPFR